MDFMNRGNRPAQPTNAPVQNNFPEGRGNKGGKFSNMKSMRFASIALLFSATILVVALLVFVVVGGNGSSEENYVNKDRMQAVFLNGGQVYFGKINDVNDKYIHLSNIFYLRVNQQVQPEQGQQQTDANDISLVKLGCELHRPTNEMLINREQVVFWENLKEDGGQNTVPGAVAEYLKQYPDGQDCEEQQQSNQQTTPTGTNGGSDTEETETPANP